MRKPSFPANAPTGTTNRERGFTMVELMVGVALGLFIVGIASAVFVAARHSFQVQDNAAHMQESARAMLEDITREIRKAGGLACYRWKDTNSPVYLSATMPAGAGGAFPLQPIDANAVIRGGDVTTSGLVLPGIAGVTPVPGTDFISVLYGQPVATLTIGTGNGQMLNHNDPYTLNRSITVSSGQPMVVADCDTATIFRADNNGSTSTLVHNLGGGNNVAPADIFGADAMLSGNTYRGGAVMMWLEMPTFFVGQDTNGLRSLYRWDTSNGGGVQPMIPNVEQMRVVFGVDAAGTAGHLNSANARMTGEAVTFSNLWQNVVSADVHLVLRSDDEAGANTIPRQYVWDSSNNLFVASGSATDHYVRQVYVVSAGLRSRLPILN
ncbi:hypothetical protein BURK2_02624 [Burkholderiales bacterium]|nr:MAG: prepilin-type N-terminal cleavage/methylation domain-containing protein [Burkholderiales bacterium]CAG0995125.1 hypothetical protein BURK2_02624 [Burkholderiales bacterium]